MIQGPGLGGVATRVCHRVLSPNMRELVGQRRESKAVAEERVSRGGSAAAGEPLTREGCGRKQAVSITWGKGRERALLICCRLGWCCAELFKHVTAIFCLPPYAQCHLTRNNNIRLGDVVIDTAVSPGDLKCYYESAILWRRATAKAMPPTFWGKIFFLSFVAIDLASFQEVNKGTLKEHCHATGL